MFLSTVRRNTGGLCPPYFACFPFSQPVASAGSQERVETMAKKKIEVPVVASEPQRGPCACGCGGFPKGKRSRFLPGPDAKLHARGSALRDDVLQLEPVAIWELPTDKGGFLAWLGRAGVTLDEFRTYPAWRYAPAALKAALRAPVGVNPRVRRPRPLRPSAVQDGTVRVDGSDA